NNNIKTEIALFLLALNLLHKENLINNIQFTNTICFNCAGNNQIEVELKNWLKTLGNLKAKREYIQLLKQNIPTQRDILGLIYQSLLAEGEKSQNGSYYTPQAIVNDITEEYKHKNGNILDPCCGTGQFLLAMSKYTKKPENLYGLDIDKIAVRIARINILIAYKDIKFVPNIFQVNTLLHEHINPLFAKTIELPLTFDLIITNPPWGTHYNKEVTENLKQIYPQIKSNESFSYFLVKSINSLDNNGDLSFILPESILNVKNHSDIRKFILQNTCLKRIVCLNRVFKNVFSAVIRIDLNRKMTKTNNNLLTIRKDNVSYKIPQKRLSQNQDNIFDINANKEDTTIFAKIFELEHTTLKNNADWALGIVTGDNKKYLSDKKREGYEEIAKGNDIKSFTLRKLNNYILFAPDKFQQTAPEYKYRAKEKLIYRFISNKLVFAYDNNQILTLNSANIVIPKLADYPIKVILALFNSSVYQFIFQKKFSSIKVLRSHIEYLPLPLLKKPVLDRIELLSNKTIKSNSCFEKLDDFIMELFSISQKEKAYIKGAIK
ncbi:MAG: N-6 DNA methylase, partial [bacterium]